MLQTLKSIVKSNAVAHRLAIAARSVLRPTTQDILQLLVRMAARKVIRPTFVKVGANDGVTSDPFGDALLNCQQWNGLLIEPVPHCFDKLRRNYSDATRFTLEQTAVGRAAGATEFYFVSEAAKHSLSDLPPWYDQLGSFDRQHIVKHLDGKLEPFIVAAEVNVEPLGSILKRHGLYDVTLLHVDTEGYDLEVLKSLGLPELCPAWIMIEHQHLSEDDRSEMLSILNLNNYDVSDTGDDFFAMHRNANYGLQHTGNVGRHFNREFINHSR